MHPHPDVKSRAFCYISAFPSCPGNYFLHKPPSAWAVHHDRKNTLSCSMLKLFAVGFGLLLLSGCATYGMIDNAALTTESTAQPYSIRALYGRDGSGEIGLTLSRDTGRVSDAGERIIITPPSATRYGITHGLPIDLWCRWTSNRYTVPVCISRQVSSTSGFTGISVPIVCFRCLH